MLQDSVPQHELFLGGGHAVWFAGEHFALTKELFGSSFLETDCSKQQPSNSG